MTLLRITKDDYYKTLIRKIILKKKKKKKKNLKPYGKILKKKKM